MAIALLTAALAIEAGCNGRSRKADDSEKPQAAQQTAAESNATDESTTAGATNGKNVAEPATTPDNATASTGGSTESAGSSLADEPVEAAPHDNAGTAQMTDEERKELFQDEIYIRIRLKMEEAIAKRRDLLKSGTESSDPEVRKLEGTIMRARQFLTESGEFVEEVDPPILISQQPAEPSGTSSPQ